jgi:hypothetical protein
MRRPITPAVHGALDYGYGAALLVLPRLLGLDRRARTLAAAFGLVDGALGAVTDQPLAVRRLVPFPLHGLIELAATPVVLLLAFLTGAARDRRARTFFLAAGATVGVVFSLTDWNAQDAEEVGDLPEPLGTDALLGSDAPLAAGDGLSPTETPAGP